MDKQGYQAAFIFGMCYCIWQDVFWDVFQMTIYGILDSALVKVVCTFVTLTVSLSQSMAMFTYSAISMMTNILWYCFITIAMPIYYVFYSMFALLPFEAFQMVMHSVFFSLPSCFYYIYNVLWEMAFLLFNAVQIVIYYISYPSYGLVFLTVVMLIYLAVPEDPLPSKEYVPRPYFQLVDLDPTSKKYDFICKLCSHTWLYKDNVGRDARNLNHKAIQITNIKTVENDTLWNKYITKRSSMTSIHLPRLPFPVRTTNYRRAYSNIMDISSQKELLLFHGTRADNIDSIVKNGFSLGKAHDGLYGRKIYFSDSCQKADQYTDYKHSRSDGKELTIILARVTIGNSAKHSDFLEYVHDSCIGGTAEDEYMRFYEFMIGNEEQCFPEYVIYYNRI